MIGSAILAAPSLAQEKKSDASPSAAAACDFPKAGPEHAVLKADAGIWDVEVSMKMGPDEKPEISKGVETVTLLGAASG